MKKSICSVLSVLLVLAMLLTGCNNQNGTSQSAVENLTTYESKNGIYSVSAPAGWTANAGGNDDLLTVDNADKSLSLVVQRFPKANVAALAPDGQAFVEYYRKSVTANLGECKSVENPSITGMTVLAAEEYSPTQNGVTAKGYLVYAESDSAYYVVLSTGLEKQYNDQFDLIKQMAVSLKEDPQAVQKAAEITISDTLRWFNATYAIITTKNGANINLVGGLEEGDEAKTRMQSGLEESWGVTDHASAEENLKWLLEEGHNIQLIEDYTEMEFGDLTRDELNEILDYGDFTAEDRAYYLVVYDAYAQFGDKAIVGWDLSRAMQMCAWYYLAGYYTYEEAMDASMEIATRLQSTFTSWDEMIQSYLYGFQYWAEDDIEDPSSDSYERKEIYETLKNMENSPFGLDWNMTFEKNW